jgi:hypothetical protein
MTRVDPAEPSQTGATAKAREPMLKPARHSRIFGRVCNFFMGLLLRWAKIDFQVWKGGLLGRVPAPGGFHFNAAAHPLIADRRRLKWCWSHF